MTDFTEKRKFNRCSKVICKAHLSIDKKQWHEIDVADLSAGGLQFYSKKAYTINEKFFIEVTVFNAYSEFNLSFEGIIKRKDPDNNEIAYGIEFINFNKYQQVQLDEIIKAKTSLKPETHHLHEDGIYAFKLVPKSKKSKIPTYR
ncbi:MAG: type pilus assembly PilZ [Clostridiales bacterium]|jgi:c-di-GMP-binding flagellar brake protein YcgR|nr:type pilus assembly PilZ [Clostridiales bacterium]